MKFMQWWNWFVTSSADPLKTSLTVKSVLTMGFAYVLHAATLACGLGLYCLGIDQSWASQVIQALTDLVYAVCMALGAVLAAIGLARKLYYGQWSAA